MRQTSTRQETTDDRTDQTGQGRAGARDARPTSTTAPQYGATEREQTRDVRAGSARRCGRRPGGVSEDLERNSDSPRTTVRVGDPTEGVLDAEVEEEIALTTARPDADRNAEAGDDLHPARQVDRGAHAGEQHEVILGGAQVRVVERFRAVPRALEHEVEVRREQPDGARRRSQRTKRAVRAVHVRARDRRASVPVRDDRARSSFVLNGRLSWSAGPAEAGTLSRASGGDDDAESRREPDRLLAAPDELAAVVDDDVAEARVRRRRIAGEACS